METLYGLQLPPDIQFPTSLPRVLPPGGENGGFSGFKPFGAISSEGFKGLGPKFIWPCSPKLATSEGLCFVSKFPAVKKL